ncbi:zinc transporter ZntB [Actibacterium sp.]|uniref:zinc transporter ZntB n=1 Tax=Actibacterium sp. TaxID=1872125 RepID=UPI003566234A
MTDTLSPLAAFDIASDGSTVALTDLWPDAQAAPGAAWRWLHLDLADPAAEPWADAHLPPVATAALFQPETRPRCDIHSNGLLLNLRGINMNPGAERDDMVSLRLWVTEGLVVSVRRRKVFALDDIRRAAADGHGPRTTGAFLDLLTDGLIDRLEQVSLKLETEADRLEEIIFENPNHSDREALATTRRIAIRLRRYVWPQREALGRLAAADMPFLPPETRHLLAETANRATRTVEELDAISARMAALQDHIYAEHSARIGRNGYVLSVVAAIFLPLSLLTGLFGVNIAGMPGLHWPYAFAVLTLGIIVLGILLYALFRWKHWF